MILSYPRRAVWLYYSVSAWVLTCLSPCFRFSSLAERCPAVMCDVTPGDRRSEATVPSAGLSVRYLIQISDSFVRDDPFPSVQRL